MLTKVTRVSASKTQPRKVIWCQNPNDLYVVIYASMGLGDMAIETLTGLTKGQIHYRQLKYRKQIGGPVPIESPRKSYRNGTSEIVKNLIKAATGSNMIKRTVVKQLDDKGLYRPVAPDR